MKAIASVSGKAGTLKAAKSICTVGKYITGPIFTLVLIWNLTIASSKSIVTVTDRIQTDTILTFGAVFFCTIVCAL